MSLDDDAQQFFAAGLQGIAAEGPNVILSFSTPVPSEDHKTRTYRTNVRIVMSSDAVKQMVEFLVSAASKAQGTDMHSMPETKH